MYAAFWLGVSGLQGIESFFIREIGQNYPRGFESVENRFFVSMKFGEKASHLMDRHR